MVNLICKLETRGYEMDARERIPAAVLVRYMEHLRWRAVHGTELGLQALFADGHSAVVRAQQLRFGDALIQDEALELDLRVGRVGRSSLCFVQTVVRARDRCEVARADVVAVVLGSNGRPAPVPESTRAHVVESDLLDSLPISDRPAEFGRRPVPIRPSDLDVLQHVNQSRYVEMVDDTLQLATSTGGVLYSSAAQSTSRPSPHRMSLVYERETLLGDDLDVLYWPSGEGQADFDLCRQSDGGLVARARACY